MSRFEHQVTVQVPVRVADDRWTRFEDFKDVVERTGGVDGWRGEIHGDEIRADATATPQPTGRQP